MAKFSVILVCCACMIFISEAFSLYKISPLDTEVNGGTKFSRSVKSSGVMRSYPAYPNEDYLQDLIKYLNSIGKRK